MIIIIGPRFFYWTKKSIDLQYQTIYGTHPISDHLSNTTQIFAQKIIIWLDYRTVKSWYFQIFHSKLEKLHFWGLKIGEVACYAAVAGVPIADNILLLLASHNNPAVSDFATDTAVADVIAAAGFFSWVSVVVMVSVVVSPHISSVPAVVGIPAVDGGTFLLLMLFPLFLHPYCWHSLIFQLSLVLFSVPFSLYSFFCCQLPWIFCCGIPTVVKISSSDVSSGCGLPLVVGVPCCSSCLLCCCRACYWCVLTDVVCPRYPCNG